MGACKIPNYLTGQRGRRWATSLISAEKAGARIVVEETGQRVRYLRDASTGSWARPWIDAKGRRYDSYDCVPKWPESRKNPRG